MARFNRSTGTTDKGIYWDLHTLPSNQFYGSGIRRWDGNEYFYGLMNNGSRVLGLYHWGTGQSCFGQNANNKRNGVNLYIYPTKTNATDYFLGNWVDGKKHGKGFYLFASGSWYYGDWVNDQKHGMIIYYNSSDGYAYYQTFRNNEKISSVKIGYYFGFSNDLTNQTLRPRHLPYSPMEYRAEHNANSDYEYNGNIVNGYWDGYGCCEWKDVMFMGEFNRGSKGTGAYFYTNGNAYFGQMANNYYNGLGMYFTSSSNLFFLGKYVNGKKNGLGVFLYSDGRMLLCNYINNSAEGNGICIYPNQVVQAQEYKAHKFVRTLYSYSSNGTSTTTSTPRPTTTTSSKPTTTKVSTTTTKTTKPKTKKSFSQLKVDDPNTLYEKIKGHYDTLIFFNNEILAEVEDEGKSHNLVLIGNSGTGKSMFAEMYTRYLYQNDLSKGVHAIELDIEAALRSSNGVSMVSNAFKDAKNTVLVINNSTCLNAFTTFRRSDIANIKDELNKNLSSNTVSSIIFTCYLSEEDDLNYVLEDFNNKINYRLKFDDLSKNQLKEIAEDYFKFNEFKFDDEVLDIVSEKVVKNKGFRSYANAKDLIALLDEVTKNCTNRCRLDYDEDDDEFNLVTEEDIPLF